MCAVSVPDSGYNVEHMAVILASRSRTVNGAQTVEGETRDVHLGLRCTPAQRQALQDRAQARGQTVSTYLLSVALEETQIGGQSTD